MEVKLLEYTPNPIKVLWTAARTCYSEDPPFKTYTRKKENEKAMLTLINSVVDMGHHSILEHVNLTFGIAGISRACSHQLVRHRIGISYSQQSQRYVSFDEGINYVMPLSIYKDPRKRKVFDFFMQDIKCYYKKLINEGIPPEDARYIFPNSCCTNITMTVNARELIQICRLRMCGTAQWEIRGMFLLAKIAISRNRNLKFLSEYLKPKCEWDGKCTEGKRCCGRIGKKQKK
jgi:thymidylate synthase (FAD)